MRYVPTGINSDIDHEANITYWLGELTTARRCYNNARMKTKHINYIHGIIAQVDNYKFHFNVDPIAIVPALLELYTWYTGIDIQSILKVEAVKTKERDAKRETKKLRIKSEAISMWRNFEIKEIPYSYNSESVEYTLLRYNKKKETVNTSKGIGIPKDIAIRLYNNIMNKVSNGGCNDCNMLVFGHYTISEITDTYILAGCHKIKLTEIQACYQAMTK